MNIITGRPVGFESDRERFRAEIIAACNQHGLEADSLLRYIEHGIQPGGFLTAVLEDRLVESANCADSFNKLHLYEWADVMYNAVPSACHGSPAKVAVWIKRGGLVSINAAGLVTPI